MATKKYNTQTKSKTPVKRKALTERKATAKGKTSTERKTSLKRGVSVSSRASKKSKTSQGNAKKIVEILAAVVLLILVVVGFLKFVPIKGEYDFEDVLAGCGYSHWGGNNAQFAYYDENTKSMVMNAQFLQSYLIVIAAKYDFDFSKAGITDKILCPLKEIGLLDNMQFLAEFVTNYDKNPNMGYTGEYGSSSGYTFVVTYKPNENLEYTGNTGMWGGYKDTKITFKGKLYIKGKTTVL